MNPIKIKPRLKHTGTVIFLHGLGDTAYGWKDVAELLSSRHGHLEFVLPTASSKPVTINGGMAMPSWYDIHGLDNRSRETCEGIDETSLLLGDLVNEQVKKNNVSCERIVIAGFSQGGAMSLYYGLQLNKKLAGVLCLSGYIPKEVSFKVSQQAQQTPTRVFHGTSDGVVQYSRGMEAYNILKAEGVQDVEFHSYKGMQHSACDEEIQDISNFLEKYLPVI